MANGFKLRELVTGFVGYFDIHCFFAFYATEINVGFLENCQVMFRTISFRGIVVLYVPLWVLLLALLLRSHFNAIVLRPQQPQRK